MFSECELAYTLTTARFAFQEHAKQTRVLALQTNIDTLFIQIRTAERAHNKEVQDMHDMHARTVEELKQERLQALQEMHQQRTRAQELENRLDNVMATQHRIRSEAEDRVRDNKQMQADQGAELRRLRSLYTEACDPSPIADGSDTICTEPCKHQKLIYPCTQTCSNSTGGESQGCTLQVAHRIA